MPHQVSVATNLQVDAVATFERGLLAYAVALRVRHVEAEGGREPRVCLAQGGASFSFTLLPSGPATEVAALT